MSETQQPKLCRADVNRANAAHSTGPRTPEGKENSKRNSFKHGLYAKNLVIPGEDPAELDRLRARLRAEHQPGNETESILVNEIAENFWRLRRMREYEARAMQPENLDKWFDFRLADPGCPQHGFRRARHVQSCRYSAPAPKRPWLRSFHFS